MCDTTEELGTTVVEDDTVGAPPTQEKGIISLVTEKVFNNGIVDAHVRYIGVFDQYIKTYTLSTTLLSTVNGMRQSYNKQNASVTFGMFKLQGLPDEFKNSHYIYTMPLKDDKGNPIKDSKQNQLQDYLIFISLNNPDETDLADTVILNANYTDAIADSANKYGLYSFVTTNLYKKSSTTPLKQYSLLELYQQSNKLLPATLSAITAAQNAYNNPVTPLIPLKKPKGGSQKSGNPSTPTGGNKGPSGGTKTPDTTKPSGSIDTRTQSASGGSSNVDFGG